MVLQLKKKVKLLNIMHQDNRTFILGDLGMNLYLNEQGK